jgi:hypothetical protein
VGEVIGERGFAHLLEDRPVVLRSKCVLDELLGDRRRALRRPTGHVGDERPADAADVDARIAPEALVLHRDDRVLHPPGDLGVGVDHDVVGRGEDADRTPVIVVQVRVHLVVVLRPVLDLRQVGSNRHHHSEQGRDDRQRAEPDEDREQAKLAHLRFRTPALPVAPPAPPGRCKRDWRVWIRALGRDVIVVAHAIECNCSNVGGRPWRRRWKTWAGRAKCLVGGMVGASQAALRV